MQAPRFVTGLKSLAGRVQNTGGALPSLHNAWPFNTPNHLHGSEFLTPDPIGSSGQHQQSTTNFQPDFFNPSPILSVDDRVAQQAEEEHVLGEPNRSCGLEPFDLFLDGLEGEMDVYSASKTAPVEVSTEHVEKNSLVRPPLLHRFSSTLDETILRRADVNENDHFSILDDVQLPDATSDSSFPHLRHESTPDATTTHAHRSPRKRVGMLELLSDTESDSSAVEFSDVEDGMVDDALCPPQLEDMRLDIDVNHLGIKPMLWESPPPDFPFPSPSLDFTHDPELSLLPSISLLDISQSDIMTEQDFQDTHRALEAMQVHEPSPSEFNPQCDPEIPHFGPSIPASAKHVSPKINAISSRRRRSTIQRDPISLPPSAIEESLSWHLSHPDQTTSQADELSQSTFVPQPVSYPTVLSQSSHSTTLPRQPQVQLKNTTRVFVKPVAKVALSKRNRSATKSRPVPARVVCNQAPITQRTTPVAHSKCIAEDVIRASSRRTPIPPQHVNLRLKERAIVHANDVGRFGARYEMCLKVNPSFINLMGGRKGQKLLSGEIKGLACHQCKSCIEPEQLAFCLTKSPEDGRRVKLCRKKYCVKCLVKFYGNEGLPADRYWYCPACEGDCTCSDCRKHAKKASSAHGRPRSKCVARTVRPRTTSVTLSSPAAAGHKTRPSKRARASRC